MDRQPEAARAGSGVAAQPLIQEIGHRAELVRGQEAVLDQGGAEVEPALDQPLAAPGRASQSGQSLREALSGIGAEEGAEVLKLVFEALPEGVEGGLDLL